jgi:hypothetical protein
VLQLQIIHKTIERSLIVINHLYIEPMVALIRSEYDIHYTKEVVL